ncbi:DUF6400 family protein [Streptomyces sp. NPDC054933]
MRNGDPNEDLHLLEIDLTRDEARRRAEVIAALGEGWDPIAVMEGEEEAYHRLYSGLDEEQTAIYHQLVAAGVLPPREGDDHAAD